MLEVALVGHADVIVGWATSLASFQLPPPPAWLERLPLIGAKLAGACFIAPAALARALPDEHAGAPAPAGGLMQTR